MLTQQLPFLEKDALLRMADDVDMGADESDRLTKQNLDAPQKIYPRLDPTGRLHHSLAASMSAVQVERQSEQADLGKGNESDAAGNTSMGKKRKRGVD